MRTRDFKEVDMIRLSITGPTVEHVGSAASHVVKRAIGVNT